MLQVALWCFGRLCLLAAVTVALVGLWVLDANFVNWAFDANAWMAKKLAGQLDPSGRLLTAFRVMNMERVLLFMEVMAVIVGVFAYCRNLTRRMFGGSPSSTPARK